LILCFSRKEFLFPLNLIVGAHGQENLGKKFLVWFNKKYSYQEKLIDLETRYADPVDSAGYIDQNVILIEFKHTLSAGQIDYQGSKGSSIEKKIRTALYQLYNNIPSRLSRAISICKDSKPPLFILAANSISSNAIEKLRNMLSKRAMEWNFNYQVILHNSDIPKIILENYECKAFQNDLHNIFFEDMPSTAPKRRKKITIPKLMDSINIVGMREVLELFMKKADSHGGKLKPNIKNVNYSFPYKNSGRSDSVLGIWPSESSQNLGLCITLSPKELDHCFGFGADKSVSMLGKIGPNPGYLGACIYVKSKDEVFNFWNELEMSGHLLS